MNLPRHRWVTVGSVCPTWFVFIGNCGFPEGLFMAWKGRTHVFQRCEFLEWREVYRAIVHRLAMAGLTLMALACQCVRDGDWIELRALVQRGEKRRK